MELSRPTELCSLMSVVSVPLKVRHWCLTCSEQAVFGCIGEWDPGSPKCSKELLWPHLCQEFCDR